MIKGAELGGIPIPELAGLPLRQTFHSGTRETIHPMGDGGSSKQVLAGSVGKVRTVISGSGNVPPGLDGLDYTSPLLLKSAACMSIISASRVIDIPSARRGDANYLPWGRAFVDGYPVPTAVSMSLDEATLSEVTGATAYQVLWYPQFNVIVSQGVQTNEDVHGAEYQWELDMIQA